ncbi:MAG: AbgT family transporter [Deltaproteobacteria bacterium]|nr:AbgT family transporter [Deltaproteobacteria bacterium]
MIERVGNLLPHPATLFLGMSMLVVVASAIAAWSGIEVAHPGTGETIAPRSLLSVEGLHQMLTGVVTNFTGFAPLGTVLVALMGIGVAEGSGLIGAAMRLLVLSAPPRLLTVVIVFSGVISNLASEIGYVLLVPLGGMVFRAAGRHPIAGLAAAFAGVSGGYSANLFLGTIDPLLAGLTQEAAQIIDPSIKVNPACNYFFMAMSTFLISGMGWLITEKVVEPRLGPWREDGAEPLEKIERLDAAERRGLLAALVTAAMLALVLLYGTIPEGGFLRNPETGEILHSPFMSGIVGLIFVAGALCGLAYGVGARTIRNDADAMRGMAKAMETLGGYLVLVFFAAQFVAYFNWSNLGLILAVRGADFLRVSNLSGIPLLIAFIFLSAFINLFMGSASAKWALMAPVFVPMLMLIGYPPELTQLAYRIGDSSTNIVSPMMSYFALIIAFFQKYDRNAGIGTLTATMLPYSVGFLAAWIVLLAVWVLLDLPLGF